MILSRDINFIRESNRIEGITHEPTLAEIEAFDCFVAQDIITVRDLQNYIDVCQKAAGLPKSELRDRPGLNVTVGKYIPPLGDITIRTRLEDILNDAASGRGNEKEAYLVHQRYESLHPFLDGNGRSGRILWLWMMERETRYSFLQHWYYQSLENWRMK